jgi:hypothetical protein
MAPQQDSAVDPRSSPARHRVLHGVQRLSLQNRSRLRHPPGEGVPGELCEATENLENFRVVWEPGVGANRV